MPVQKDLRQLFDAFAGKVVWDQPLGTRAARGEWKFIQTTKHSGYWQHKGTGRRVAAVPQWRAGAKRFAHPEFRAFGTKWRLPQKIERKRRQRAIGRFFSGPGVLGLLTGLTLPSLLSTVAMAGTSGIIALAGYLSPSGSWIRRFSVGAGVGGGVRAGYALAKMIPFKSIYRELKIAHGAARIAFNQPWQHWLPFVGPIFQTLQWPASRGLPFDMKVEQERRRRTGR